jgi:hypothetical protein
MPACQQEINDSHDHHHESIDKEPAISQHENVTENYSSHPHNSHSRSQSGCLRDQEQNRHNRVIRSIDFYDDLAKWTAIEVIDGIG